MGTLLDLPTEIHTDILLRTLGHRLSYKHLDLENLLKAFPFFMSIADDLLQSRTDKTITQHQKITLQVAVSVVQGKLIRRVSSMTG